MKKSILTGAAVALLLLGSSSLAYARCFGFRGQDIKVCVEGSNGSARSRAVEVCHDVSDGRCQISGDSGECRRSSSVRCYDANGREQSHINPD